MANNDSRTHFKKSCGVNRYLYSSPRFILSAVCCFVLDYGCNYEDVPYNSAVVLAQGVQSVLWFAE